MAIEIIPKPKIKAIPWLKIIFYLLLLIFLAILISYFIFDSLQKKLNQKLAEYEKALRRTPEEEKLEREVRQWKEKIEDFQVLLAAHQKTTNIFKFLEEKTHPQIWFSEFNFEGKSEIEISGRAPNFQILGQQILIFLKEGLIKNLNLTDVSIEEGEVKFKLRLTFDPQILK